MWYRVGAVRSMTGGRKTQPQLSYKLKEPRQYACNRGCQTVTGGDSHCSPEEIWLIELFALKTYSSAGLSLWQSNSLTHWCQDSPPSHDPSASQASFCINISQLLPQYSVFRQDGDVWLTLSILMLFILLNYLQCDHSVKSQVPYLGQRWGGQISTEDEGLATPFLCPEGVTVMIPSGLCTNDLTGHRSPKSFAGNRSLELALRMSNSTSGVKRISSGVSG
ncbi:hypothetical protein E2C01_008864 [Portunus trituberculatus]|uniref:Uncharacterized protein n=1 Tax=Portunus trituberculatus TaxID=210409 RepID=A0A5B7D5M2_PORTR|nr:hypothetical protein [Portunus trituberculatus]